MPLPIWLYSFLPFGRRSEIHAAGYLRSLGYRVTASGYRTRTGEIDLIAWEGKVLVFVEVKALSSDAAPEDAVGSRKRQRILSAARSYISRYRLHESPHRFDILAVTVLPGQKTRFRLIRDAFREGSEKPAEDF